MGGSPHTLDPATRLWVCDQGHVTEDHPRRSGDEEFGWAVNTCRPPGQTCGRLQWEMKNEAVRATYMIAGWHAASSMWRAMSNKERK